MILASASPRRYDLLHRVGFEPEVRPANVDERALPGEAPTHLVERLAKLKAQAVWDELSPSSQTEAQQHATPHSTGREAPGAHTDAILAADTVVWTPELGILGKPHSSDEAFDMLRHLSGRTHSVSTGVCLMVGRGDSTTPADTSAKGATPPEPRTKSFVETTQVTFFTLDDRQIRAYVATGEPMDKAGAYGIQGIGRLLVRQIEGDYSNVVGLPVTRVVRELGQLVGRDLVSELLCADKGQELVTYD